MKLLPALLAATLATSLTYAAPFSIDQVLGAPFPSELIASSTGGKVAWIFESRGVRNLWIAEAPDFKAHPLTSYSSDAGQEIGDVAWSADASSLVYARGGDANGRGELPNPTSNPAGVTQAVYVISAAGGVPRLVGNGASPAISPDSRTIAYLNHGQIW